MSGNLFNSVTGSVNYSILDTNINEITKNIYIGDKRTAKNHLLLKELGIKKIVVAGHELNIHYPQEFDYLHIPIKDSLKQEIYFHFEKVCEFIEKGVINGEGVFVHCAFGISRSSSFVIAYLMKKLKISFRQAFAYVRRKRAEINPNINFEQQLKNWECSLKKM